MATLNPALCPMIISAAPNLTRIGNDIWRARRALSWWAGEHLTNRNIADAAEFIAEQLRIIEPQNVTSAGMSSLLLSEGHNVSEYVVRKIMDELIEAGIPYNAERKAEAQG